MLNLNFAPRPRNFDYLPTPMFLISSKMFLIAVLVNNVIFCM